MATQPTKKKLHHITHVCDITVDSYNRTIIRKYPLGSWVLVSLGSFNNYHYTNVKGQSIYIYIYNYTTVSVSHMLWQLVAEDVYHTRNSQKIPSYLTLVIVMEVSFVSILTKNCHVIMRFNHILCGIHLRARIAHKLNHSHVLRCYTFILPWCLPGANESIIQ